MMFGANPAVTGTHGGRRPTLCRPKADAGGSGGEAPSKMGSFGVLLGPTGFFFARTGITQAVFTPQGFTRGLDINLDFGMEIVNERKIYTYPCVDWRVHR